MDSTYPKKCDVMLSVTYVRDALTHYHTVDRNRELLKTLWEKE